MKRWIAIIILALLSAAGWGGSLNQYDPLSNVKTTKPWESVSNCMVVGDADNPETAYDTLIARTDMGTLSATNRRVLILLPGTYTITSTWELDTEYVDIAGITGSPKETIITCSSAIESYVVEVTARDVQISNLSILTISGELAALAVNNTTEGSCTTSNIASKINAAGIGTNFVVGKDAIYIYGGGLTPGWKTPLTVAADKSYITVSETIGTHTGCSYEIVSNRLLVTNVYLDTMATTTVPTLPYNQSGLYAVKHLPGVWKNIELGNCCGTTAATYEICGYFDGIYGKGKDKIFGTDERGTSISGTIRNFYLGPYAIGGCATFGCDIDSSAIIESGVVGTNSVATGRTIAGLVRNVRGTTYCFAGKSAGTIASTGATGTDAAGSVLTVSNNVGYYGQSRGKAGLIVYISGTNCTAGYYEVLSVTGTDTVTLVTNASSGGAMSDLTITYGLGQITGTVENCSAADADSFADENNAPYRVTGTGLVRGCFSASGAVSLP